MEISEIDTMTKKPVIQPQDKYVLRLPDGLRDRIKAYAERHGRSMNAEIVRVLEREFPAPADVLAEAAPALLEALISLVEYYGPIQDPDMTDVFEEEHIRLSAARELIEKIGES